MIVNPGIRRAGGGLYRRLSFFAPLIKSLVPARGTGSATFTRATTATVFGYAATANEVDGQTLLTVASNEARFTGARRISEGVWSDTFADGNPIPATTLKGYLAEGAGTQLIAATADIRDMTTPSWVLGATMTRARTSIGADGAANSATRLTGGTVAATNTCYYTLVAPASLRTYSALVKRVTGTGPVRIVQTGTETDISSLINSSTYTLVQLTASVLDATIGFKIDTNLDAIDVDFNQFEAGAFATSRMATTGAARNADVLTYQVSGNISGTAGTAYIEMLKNNSDSAYPINIRYDTNTYVLRTITQILVSDGTTTLNYSAGTFPSLAIQKIASSWGPSGIKCSKNGEAVGTTSFDGDMNILELSLGGSADGVGPLNGNIRNVRIWQRALSDSELVSITS